MALNSSLAFDLPPLPSYELRPLPSLIPWFNDKYLALAMPIIAYWVVSGLFHIIDTLDLFPQYRLHVPAEILKRNHASRWEVFRDVILQQIIQTLVGVTLEYIEGPDMHGREEYDIAVWAQRLRILQKGIPVVLGVVGVNAGLVSQRIATSSPSLAGALAGGRYPALDRIITVNGHAVLAPAFAPWEMVAAKAIYHFVIPALQFFLGIFIVDTWQYFWHRGMHMNKWLYTAFHSRHHRLYVPYAYGALYNHPVEGFLLDTLGAGVAYLITGMTTRQTMWFFSICTIKTVDDHCGYALPFDPLQHLTGNNASYHDIHHQSWGIKTNFSQPFFTFWDHALGTVWAGDVSRRYERTRKAAEQWLAGQHGSAQPAALDQKAAHAERVDPYDEDADENPGQPELRPVEAAAGKARASRKLAARDDAVPVAPRRSSPRKKSGKAAPPNGHAEPQRVNND